MKTCSRVLIVDDHPLFSEGLKGLLIRLHPTVTVCQARSIDDARRLAESGFELVLMDLQMPGVSGMPALAVMKDLFPEASIVVVSSDDSPATIRNAIQHGAAGYVPKCTPTAVIGQALNLVMSQGTYLPTEALPAPPTTSSLAPEPACWSGALSPRQLAVLRCLLQGKPNKVIARDIGIAEGTVKAHLWSVYQLLGVRSRAQAMYRAHELKIFSAGGVAAPTASASAQRF